jgi:hypothetical protein
VDAVVADLQELRDAWSFVFKEKDESSTSWVCDGLIIPR